MSLDDARRLTEAIEDRDQDGGVFDEMLGETGISHGELEGMVNRVVDAFGLEASENDVREILRTYLDKVALMDEIEDTEIQQLFLELSEDLQVYSEFITDMVRIDDGTEDPSEMMSTNEGRIARIDIQVVMGWRAVSTVRSLDAAFDPNVEIVMMVSRDKWFEFGEAFENELQMDRGRLPSGRKVRIVKAPREHHVKTLYLRDTHVKLADGTLVVQHADLTYSSDNIVRLGRRLGVDVELEDQLVYQGGNMRATENVLYVGAKVVRDSFFGEGSHFNSSISRQDMEKAREALEERFGKKVIIVGIPDDKSGWRPPPSKNLFHIDLFLTPVSDSEIIVASNDVIDSSVQNMLEAVHEQAPHIRVIRIPTPDIDGVLLSYSNCLVERFEENGELVTRFYIPRYHTRDVQREIDHVRSIDIQIDEESYRQKDLNDLADLLQRQEEIEGYNEAAIQFYESLELAGGWRVEVVPVDVDITLVMHERNGGGGSLNCLTNEFRAPGE